MRKSYRVCGGALAGLLALAVCSTGCRMFGDGVRGPYHASYRLAQVLTPKVDVLVRSAPRLGARADWSLVVPESGYGVPSIAEYEGEPDRYRRYSGVLRPGTAIRVEHCTVSGGALGSWVHVSARVLDGPFADCLVDMAGVSQRLQVAGVTFPVPRDDLVELLCE